MYNANVPYLLYVPIVLTKLCTIVQALLQCKGVLRAQHKDEYCVFLKIPIQVLYFLYTQAVLSGSYILLPGGLS